MMRIALVVLLAAAGLSNISCKDKGPAEQAGEKIDDAKDAAAEATAGASVGDAVAK